MIVSSSGRLRILTPIVPFPQINPSSQVVAGLELINPLSDTFSFLDWDIAPLEVSSNKNIKTTGKQIRVFIISNFNSISKFYYSMSFS